MVTRSVLLMSLVLLLAAAGCGMPGNGDGGTVRLTLGAYTTPREAYSKRRIASGSISILLPSCSPRHTHLAMRRGRCPTCADRVTSQPTSRCSATSGLRRMRDFRCAPRRSTFSTAQISKCRARFWARLTSVSSPALKTRARFNSPPESISETVGSRQFVI
jgi:hypothetical protein